jgi:hypothetical protein
MEEIRKGLKRDVEVQRSSKVGVPIQVELKSNSDSSNSPHHNRRPYHIPTPFWTFFIWMEREEDQLSNGASLISKFLVTVLCYRILAPWAMYQVGPNRGTS